MKPIALYFHKRYIEFDLLKNYLEKLDKFCENNNINKGNIGYYTSGVDVLEKATNKYGLNNMIKGIRSKKIHTVLVFKDNVLNKEVLEYIKENNCKYFVI